jgi:hypothetical protein
MQVVVGFFVGYVHFYDLQNLTHNIVIVASAEEEEAEKWSE